MPWTPRRHAGPDPDHDPVFAPVVTALRALPTPTPDPQFRAELRAQVVALADRLATEAGPESGAEPGRTAVRRGRPWRVARRSLVAVVSAAAAVLLVLSGVVWASGRSVPGDTLYGLKRAREDVRLTLARGDTDRGKAYLDRAHVRAGEVLALWTRATSDTPPAQVAAGAGSAADRMRSALDDADGDLRDGTRLLTVSAVRDRSAGDLGTLASWGTGQLTQLRSVAAAVPAGALHDRAARSADLVAAAVARASALRTDLACRCLTAAPSDALGPVPCTPCAAPSGAPVPSGPVPSGGGGSSPGGASGTVAPTTPRPGSGGSAPASGPGGAGSGGPGGPGGSGGPASGGPASGGPVSGGPDGSVPASSAGSPAPGSSSPGDPGTGGPVSGPGPTSDDPPTTPEPSPSRGRHGTGSPSGGATTSRHGHGHTSSHGGPAPLPTCGVAVTLPPVSVGIGICPTH